MHAGDQQDRGWCGVCVYLPNSGSSFSPPGICPEFPGATLDRTTKAQPITHKCHICGGRQVAIDVIKHAVISKFNDMRPGLYRELFKDVCEKARTGNSHTARRIVAFDPFAPAAFAVRIGITAWTALRETGLKGAPSITWKQFWAYGIAAWTTLLFIKVLLGYGLQVSAAHYLDHYDRTHAGKGRNPVRAAPSRQEGKKVD